MTRLALAVVVALCGVPTGAPAIHHRSHACVDRERACDKAWASDHEPGADARCDACLEAAWATCDCGCCDECWRERQPAWVEATTIGFEGGRIWHCDDGYHGFLIDGRYYCHRDGAPVVLRAPVVPRDPTADGIPSRHDAEQDWPP